jgi:UDP:flavonoid glycosyltransferase YjiC (YdhE family)
LQDDLPLAETAARALADHPVRAVVTLGPDHDPNDISAPSPNVRIERLVPHSAVLKRGVLLVSHAGHGSVMKALWFGRPMVLVPWGRDQAGVAARADALGVATVVSRADANPDSLCKAIAQALWDDDMRAQAAETQRAARHDVSAREGSRRDRNVALATFVIARHSIGLPGSSRCAARNLGGSCLDPD